MRKFVEQLNMNILCRRLVEREHEDVRGCAEILLLVRSHIRRFQFPDLLDLHIAFRLNGIVVDVGQIILVDKHTAEVYGQFQLQVAGVLVDLHIGDLRHLSVLSAFGTERTTHVVTGEKQ